MDDSYQRFFSAQAQMISEFSPASVQPTEIFRLKPGPWGLEKPEVESTRQQGSKMYTKRKEKIIYVDILCIDSFVYVTKMTTMICDSMWQGQQLMPRKEEVYVCYVWWFLENAKALND